MKRKRVKIPKDEIERYYGLTVAPDNYSEILDDEESEFTEQ